MPSIVQVNVQQTIAPTPSTLQGTYALLSMGGTTTSPGTLTLLTAPSSLTNYLTPAKAVTSIANATGTATVTTTTAHGLPTGSVISITIAGSTIAAYNGTFPCTITTTTAFTYGVPSGTATPATGTITYQLASSNELNSMVTTWFAQNFNTSVYVLELGAVSVNSSIAFLAAWIIANPNGIAYGNNFYGIYAYVIPRLWDANTNFITLIQSYEGTTAKTYFFTTTTLSTYTAYTALMKPVVALIENWQQGTYPANVFTACANTGGLTTATTTTAHGVAVGQWFQVVGCTPAGYNGFWQAAAGTTGSSLVWAQAVTPGTISVEGSLVASQYASTGVTSTEFSIASAAQVAASFNPSGGFVPPFAFSFLAGVTPVTTLGNNAILTTLQSASVNVVGTGAEGGISNAILMNGTTMDGNPFNYWYAIDWLNININLNISNAVINGSNNTLNPLYLSQAGINSLQAVGAQTISSGITAGLIFGSLAQTELAPAAFAAQLAAGNFAGQAVINAIPFATYYTTNPGQYATRTYNGFSASIVPQFGFEHITFNINATTFVG